MPSMARDTTGMCNFGELRPEVVTRGMLMPASGQMERKEGGGVYKEQAQLEI
jgi:hypothetical protein